MDVITKTIFALGGDLHGDSLFMELCGCPSKNVSLSISCPSLIECRLESMCVPMLVNLLRTVIQPFGSKTCVSSTSVNQNQICVLVSSKDSSDALLIIRVTPAKRLTWSQDCSFFDIELLAMSSYSIYTRMDYPELHNIPCKIGWLLSRVIKKNFCVLDLDHDNNNPKQIAALMCRAMKMVSDGWLMDDALNGRKSWVVSQFKDISSVRINQSPIDSELCVSQTECAICKDDFEDDDMVVNLRCNHTFHVRCKEGCCGGMESWLIEHEKGTCPMCRREVLPPLDDDPIDSK